MRATNFVVGTLAAVLSSATVVGCNGDETPSDRQETPQAQQPLAPVEDSPWLQQLRTSCPMVVGGAEVGVSDTADGIALTFTTDDGDVAELRQRVAHLAHMYEMHHRHGAMAWHHMHGRRGGFPARRMRRGHMLGPMPAANATVTELEDGARLELTPVDDAQLAALREHARWHQQRMQAGECWWLEKVG